MLKNIVQCLKVPLNWHSKITALLDLFRGVGQLKLIKNALGGGPEVRGEISCNALLKPFRAEFKIDTSPVHFRERPEGSNSQSLAVIAVVEVHCGPS